jgi:hypothetical protein
MAAPFPFRDEDCYLISASYHKPLRWSREKAAGVSSIFSFEAQHEKGEGLFVLFVICSWIVGGSNPCGGSRGIEGLPTVASDKPFFATPSNRVESDAEGQGLSMRTHRAQGASWPAIQQLNYVPFSAFQYKKLFYFSLIHSIMIKAGPQIPTAIRLGS